MCVGLGQLKVKLEEAFKRGDFKEVENISVLIEEIEKHKPKSLRINLWKSGLILIRKDQELLSLKAQFAWTELKKDGKTWPVFNVRAEGGWKNKENDPNYTGDFHIYTNPYVKELMPGHRCVVPADFFIEQPSDKKVKKKFLIKRKDDEALFLGGVYKTFVDIETGEISYAFAIITTAYSDITFKVGHQRCPLIIEPKDLMRYLDPKLRASELNSFFKPADSSNLCAHEVGLEIAKRQSMFSDDDLFLIEPCSALIEG